MVCYIVVYYIILYYFSSDPFNPSSLYVSASPPLTSVISETDNRHKLVQYVHGSWFIYQRICLPVHSSTASSFRIRPQS